MFSYEYHFLPSFLYCFPDSRWDMISWMDAALEYLIKVPSLVRDRAVSLSRLFDSGRYPSLFICYSRLWTFQYGSPDTNKKIVTDSFFFQPSCITSGYKLSFCNTFDFWWMLYLNILQFLSLHGCWLICFTGDLFLFYVKPAIGLAVIGRHQSWHLEMMPKCSCLIL